MIADFDVQDSGVLADCGPFSVIDDATAHVVVTLQFDRSGEPFRATLRVRGTDTLSNSVTGSSYSSTNVFTDTVNFHRGVEVKAGVGYTVTVPHYGSVLLDAGVIKIDPNGEVTLTGGPHVSPGTDLGPLCEAFA
jgi:hypothetical protein